MNEHKSNADTFKHGWLAWKRNAQYAKVLSGVIGIAAIGTVVMFVTHAATSTASVQAESGAVSSAASIVSDTSASGNKAVKFGAGSGGGTTTPLDVNCNYQTDTWSGDATNVGYSVTKLSSVDGNPASFSVRLNANPGTTEVVGYPSVQCILYSALPANLTSSFNTTPPTSSSGLDYEYAYDIWLTTASAAQSYNWDTDLELMIWTYTNGQVPINGYNPANATLSDGAKVWVAGSNTTGTVSVVYPNKTSGTVNIASIVSQLKSLGYISNTYDGVLSVEYGIEAPYGGGQTFSVNSLSLSN